MFGLGYKCLESSQWLSIRWVTPTIGFLSLPLGVALLALAAGGWYYRNSLAGKLGAALYAPWITPRRLQWMCAFAGGVGLLALLFSPPPRTLARWDFTHDEIHIQSLNGDLRMPYADVVSVRLAPAGEKKKNVSLVLKDKSGREGWLVLKWILATHRQRVLQTLAGHLPELMKPIIIEYNQPETA